MQKQAKTSPDLVGLKQVRKAVNANAASRVFYALDADPALIDPLLELCKQHGVACESVRTMRELGSRCGIDVGAAVAAIRR